MVILEGTRRSGKSYTTKFIEDNFAFYNVYKDQGIRILQDTASLVDVDDYVIGRDLAYAQLMKIMPDKMIKRIFFDRQYLSSYVYGQFYRDKYNKQFWTDHIHRVEEVYGENFLKNSMMIIFIELESWHFEKIAKLNRKKDVFECDNIDSYKRQYELYQEVLDITQAPVFKMKAFQDLAYLTKFFTSVWKKNNTAINV